MDEYISATVGKDLLNVGEYWVDMKWNGSELDANQDAARQVRQNTSRVSHCVSMCHAWC